MLAGAMRSPQQRQGPRYSWREQREHHRVIFLARWPHGYEQRGLDFAYTAGREDSGLGTRITHAGGDPRWSSVRRSISLSKLFALEQVLSVMDGALV